MAGPDDEFDRTRVDAPILEVGKRGAIVVDDGEIDFFLLHEAGCFHPVRLDDVELYLRVFVLEGVKQARDQE